MADYDVVNAVWGRLGARQDGTGAACVQVGRLASPGWKVEIAVQARSRLNAPGARKFLRRCRKFTNYLSV